MTGKTYCESCLQRAVGCCETVHEADMNSPLSS